MDNLCEFCNLLASLWNWKTFSACQFSSITGAQVLFKVQSESKSSSWISWCERWQLFDMTQQVVSKREQIILEARIGASFRGSSGGGTFKSLIFPPANYTTDCCCPWIISTLNSFGIYSLFFFNWILLLWSWNIEVSLPPPHKRRPTTPTTTSVQ